jgi:hippurate hydrolase
MHACGHDIHMASMVGAGQLLARAKDRWRGTLLLVAQPAEETVGGAIGMINDPKWRRFPKADFVLAMHDSTLLPAGAIGITPGFAMANVDAVDITIFGKGGHGSAPQSTIDPIVIAARTVTALQTIVARENDPRDPAVVTVGSIHGGPKHNIIPDEVKLQLTVRSYKDTVRTKLLAAISRITKAEALAGGAPREPIITRSEGGSAVYNDPALSKRIGEALSAANFAEVEDYAPVMAAEDFGEFGRAAKAPSVLFWVGGVPRARWNEASGDPAQLPSLHSPLWAPDHNPTVKSGVSALVVAALELLGKPQTR